MNDSPLNHRLFLGETCTFVCKKNLVSELYLQFIHVYIDIFTKMAYYLCTALNAKSKSAYARGDRNAPA